MVRFLPVSVRELAPMWGPRRLPALSGQYRPLSLNRWQFLIQLSHVQPASPFAATLRSPPAAPILSVWDLGKPPGEWPSIIGNSSIKRWLRATELGPRRLWEKAFQRLVTATWRKPAANSR